ncbi:hypothetical protein MPER_14552, partial [Moniliophthora perniciosa FA553]
FYGTYMGDYFEIQQKRRVTGFPFNILEHPMYTGTIYVHATYNLADELRR